MLRAIGHQLIDEAIEQGIGSAKFRGYRVLARRGAAGIELRVDACEIESGISDMAIGLQVSEDLAARCPPSGSMAGLGGCDL